MINLSIIIVNYNTSQLLKNCLQAVFQALNWEKHVDSCEVIVIDNASTDDSLDIVRRYFPDVHLICNQENLGFSKANNQALRKSQGKYMLLLNSDTSVKQTALVKLLEYIKSEKNIGAIGGKLLNPDGSIQPSVGFFPHLSKVFFWMSFLDDLPFMSSLLHSYHVEDKNFYLKRQQVDWVSGACILVKKEAVEKAGLFDEAIFMYGEEVEWCYRIKQAGFQVIYTPWAEIFHLKGESSVEKVNAGIVAEFRGILYFYQKHKSLCQQYLLKLLLKSGALLRILLFGIIMRHPKKADLYAKAFRLVG